ncbi:sugar ABC transporter ATP-binding protein [soil metagenome]
MFAPSILSPEADRAAAPPILAAACVTRRFGSTQALAGGSLRVRPGEVHGLLGANGAGKSTLSRIVSGHLARDGGEITWRGAPFAPRSVRDGINAGIALVAQETSLAPDLSVLENIFLPELGRRGRLSFPALRRRATEILSRLGHEHALPLDAEVRRLSAAQRQLVEIAKALALDATLVIFDEPTASLSPTEVERLFDIMARLRDDGRAIMFVSHRLEEVFVITDRVTILRDGTTVADDLPTSGLTQAEIIRHMVGRELGAIYARREALKTTGTGRVVFEVEGLAAAPVVRDVSFAVRRGEIFGLGGLVGAGRSETAEAIFGLRPRQAGSIRIDGRAIDPKKPAQAIAAGIGLVAEDRRSQNIVPDLTVRENIFLAHIGMRRGLGLGYGRRERRLRELMDQLGLPRDRLGANLLTFSGGMQQKVIIARWLLVEPKVLILDEPTKGVDIGTRSAIYGILRKIADDGVAVVVISSDFEELLGICERVVVMSDGATIADLPASSLTEEKLTLLAAPRTSTARNTRLLQDLVREHGGSAFWALVEEAEVICLATAAAPDAPGIGLHPGRATSLSQTAILHGLAHPGPGFVEEPGSGLATLVVPLRTPRGHDLGSIGLVLPPAAPRPPASAIARRVAALADPEKASSPP